MPRFFPGVVLLLFAAAMVFATCDAPLSTDLLSPDGSRHEIVDGRDIPSNVYLLPPIGESYTAIDFDDYTPTRVEVCSLDDPNTGVPLEEYTDAMWDDLEDVGCLDPDVDPWFDWYQETSSSEPGVFIELKRDASGNPLHYQVNLKTDEGMADQTFRVTVFTLSASPTSGVYWQPKAWFGIGLFANASAINVPDDWIGETAGKNFPAKYVVEREESDSFVAGVDCESLTLFGPTAGVLVQDNTFDGCGNTTIVLVQEPVTELGTDNVCLPVGWEQDGPCYRWQLYEFDGNTFTVYDGVIPEDKPLTVAYCLTDESVVYDALWSGFKTPDQESSTVTATINTESGYETQFDCSLLNAETTALSGVLQRVRQFFGVDPKPLYAAHGGFGELVGGTFSHFGRAKAQTLPADSATGDDQAGLINSTLSEPLVVQALTIPHTEGILQGDGSYVYVTDDPVAVEGEQVTFKILDGGGTLTSASGSGKTVSAPTNAQGYAQVSWTLGPDASPPDQTVIAYGPFGTLVNDQFVADTIWFSATAYDVVTDFVEPLDPKDGYSGDAITGIVPGVVICASEGGVADCDTFSQQFDETEIKVTEDSGRWFFQANWKPRDFGIAEGTYVVHVVLYGGVVVGESVEIVVDKGGKVELVDGQLQINPTTDLPIKFTLSQIAL